MTGLVPVCARWFSISSLCRCRSCNNCCSASCRRSRCVGPGACWAPGGGTGGRCEYLSAASLARLSACSCAMLPGGASANTDDASISPPPIVMHRLFIAVSGVPSECSRRRHRARRQLWVGKFSGSRRLATCRFRMMNAGSMVQTVVCGCSSAVRAIGNRRLLESTRTSCQR